MDLIQRKVVRNILQNCMLKRSEIRGFRTWCLMLIPKLMPLSQCCYVWARIIFQSGATSENYTLNLLAFTGGSTVQHTHTYTEEKSSSRGRLTRAGTFVIIKCFGVSRVERPLIDISWNKDQPHLLCHSLRWRGKYSWPFFALDAIFPLFTPDSP